MKQFLVLLTLVYTCLSPSLACADGVEKWFYAYVDLLRDEIPTTDETNYTTEELKTLFKDLKEHKYMVVVLSSYQLGDKSFLNPSDADTKIRDNLAAIKLAAHKHGIEIIPEVMSVGASEKILQTAYHLAEATPVRRQRLRLVETDGSMILGLPSGDNLLHNSTFSGTRDQLKKSWEIDDSFDNAVKQRPLDQELNLNALEFDLSLATGIEVGQNDIFFNPWHQYRLSFTLKTCAVGPADSKGTVEFYAKVRGKDGGRYVKIEDVDFKVTSTQPETNYQILLNSFHCAEGQFWFGFPNGSAGKAVISNVRLEEALGPNMIRRQDTEVTANEKEVLRITVFNESAGKPLQEGKDFAEWRDSEVIENGFRHNRRDFNIQFLPDRVNLDDKISVSYFHATLPNASHGKVCCSLRHPEVFNIFRQQLEAINSIVQPRRWMIDHDEIRAMGHDPLSKADAPGVILAENLKKCIDLLQLVDPGAEVVLFNDMYDPNHNAVAKTCPQSFFPMVSGDFTDSWKGLNESVTILNWQTAQRPMNKDDISAWKKSLDHFRDRKTPQIISGFYDVVPDSQNASESVTRRAELIFSTAKGDDGDVTPAAVCYYTTKRNTDFLKQFAETAESVLAP
ncbi:MAG: hypothetical protein U0936_21470 [Planctomycetaceae bacterium]